MDLLPIANGFYKSRSLPASAQECANWYPVKPEVPTLSEFNLFGTPGLTQIVSVDVRESCRGGLRMGDKAFFVVGTSLYRINLTTPSGVETWGSDDLGTIEGSGRVSMATNGTQLCILNPGGKGYIFTESPDTLVEITDGDFDANGNPQSVEFIDGYFVFTTDTRKFIISDLNDGTAYNALDFGSAEADPDNIVCPMVAANQLYIGGEFTIEGFRNIGGADFPFQRNGIFVDKGVINQFAHVTAANTLYFMGGGKNEPPAVWSMQTEPQKISTEAIDNKIAELSTDQLANVFAWYYAELGHYFVGFTSSRWTFVYDLTTGLWHERRSGQTGRQRSNAYVQVYGRVLCGDNTDGRIGILSSDTYSEYGEEIHRVVSGQPFQNAGETFFVPFIELTMESGVGDSPLVTMEMSADGGKTFYGSRTRSLGAVGEYGTRAMWTKNGKFDRFMTLRFSFSEMVKPVILQLAARIV